MSIGQIMSKKVRSIAPTASLIALRQIFDETHFQHVPVVDSMQRLLGIISVKDYYRVQAPLLEAASGHTLEVFLKERKVQGIMTAPAISVKQHCPVLEAAALLLTHNISCLPVVDDLNRLIGIVSWKDIMRLVVLRQVQKRTRGPNEEE